MTIASESLNEFIKLVEKSVNQNLQEKIKPIIEKTIKEFAEKQGIELMQVCSELISAKVHSMSKPDGLEIRVVYRWE